MAICLSEDLLDFVENGEPIILIVVFQDKKDLPVFTVMGEVIYFLPTWF
jgi:hypothetical protein